MNLIFKGIGLLIGIFIFLGLLGAIFGPHDTPLPDSPTSTKTAYTRDGINFVSKERVAENIKYEYAKRGDYKEVSVPLSTIVVGESVVPDDTPEQEEKTIPKEQTATILKATKTEQKDISETKQSSPTEVACINCCNFTSALYLD